MKKTDTATQNDASRWPTVRLGDIGKIVRGNGIKRSDTVSAGFPCLRYGEIYTSYNFIFDKAKSFVTKKTFDDSLHIKNGDIVFALTGETEDEIAKALAYLGDDEVAAGGDLAVWTDHGCNPKYLAYLMYTPAMIKAKALASNGQIIVHMSVKKLQEIAFPLPPLVEQKKIVAKVEKDLARVEALRVQFERMEQAAKDLFSAALAEEFANVKGDKVRLGDVCEEISTGPYGSALHKSDYIINGIPIVNPINICNHKILPDGKTVSRETVDRLSSYKLRVGDIVIARRGEMGRAAQVTRREDGWLCGTGSFFLRLKDCVSPEYFVQWFGSPLVVELLEKNSTGATMPNLNHTILAATEIPLPSLAVQREIVARLDAAKERSEGIAAAARSAVATCEKLRKAILSEAFQ